MKPLAPVAVRDLFPSEREALLLLLADLLPDHWSVPTICAGWSVKDVALHLLGDDIGLLSRRRDRFAVPQAEGIDFSDWDALVAFVNRQNGIWVEAARRISPVLLLELLRFTGEATYNYFCSLDLAAPGDSVNWISADPAPIWLELAREFTERWTHQQHIREALDRPGVMERLYLAPALDTFVRSLPRAYRSVDARGGTVVQCVIEGDAGGVWSLLKGEDRWTLWLATPDDPEPASTVIIRQVDAWKLFTRGIDKRDLLQAVTFRGDHFLGLPVLDAVSIIA